MDEIISLLSGFEVTPFGSPPTFNPVSPPKPPSTSQITIAQGKIYALAVRAYTAENTVLSLSRAGIGSQAVMGGYHACGSTAAEGKLARIEANLDV